VERGRGLVNYKVLDLGESLGIIWMNFLNLQMARWTWGKEWSKIGTNSHWASRLLFKTQVIAVTVWLLESWVIKVEIGQEYKEANHPEKALKKQIWNAGCRPSRWWVLKCTEKKDMEKKPKKCSFQSLTSPCDDVLNEDPRKFQDTESNCHMLWMWPIKSRLSQWEVME
jgi:hypothetical protein